jgi:thymidylate kinase
MEKAREGFRNLAAAEPDRLVLVDASQPEEILAKQIQNVLREGLAI